MVIKNGMVAYTESGDQNKQVLFFGITGTVSN
jgi:hypothetical protein